MIRRNAPANDLCSGGGGPTRRRARRLDRATVSVTLRNNFFRRIDPAKSRIVLLDGGIASFRPSQSRVTKGNEAANESSAVEVSTGVKVEKVDDQGVIAAGVRIPSRHPCFGGRRSASPVVKMLGTQTEPRRARFSLVPSWTFPRRHVFVAGDAAR